MAKLTDLHIVKLFDDDRIVFDTPVSVTKDGMFTTTLPREAAETLESYGPKLDVNRAGRAGFFSAAFSAAGFFAAVSAVFTAAAVFSAGFLAAVFFAAVFFTAGFFSSAGSAATASFSSFTDADFLVAI